MKDFYGQRKAILYDIGGNVAGIEERNQSDRSGIYVNQCGYDIDKPKFATIPNKTGAVFVICDEGGHTVHSGRVAFEKADFTAVDEPGTYYIKCGTQRSQNFKIADNRIRDVSALNALKFMEMARQDTFEVGAETGYGWRDSHQFSFELNTLVMMYLADSAYWKSLPWDVYRISDCEYQELRTQSCPNIVWLMLFGVTRYHDWSVNKGIKLHGLIKEQVAYVLWAYPMISEYVSDTWYNQMRDWLISIWGEDECNKQWYAIPGENHNLYATQSVIGTVKGQYPPGHAIMPNLLMSEVCKRDGLPWQKFYTSGLTNLNWLVNEVDLNDPANTKGQRMSEYITFHNLTMAYEMFGSQCPGNTAKVIKECAALFCSRSNNKWDYVQYTTADDMSDAEDTRWVNMETSGGLCNQPGNVAGMMGIAYMLLRCLPEEETGLRDRLRQLAVSHIDHVYGRNPLGRHFCYTATEEFDGATKGWVSRMGDGYGALDGVIGILDGSPKEDNYPFNPAGDTGYTEGWVAFNSAWNMSLAYLMMT